MYFAKMVSKGSSQLSLVLSAIVTMACDQALETRFLIGQLLANDDCALHR